MINDFQATDSPQPMFLLAGTPVYFTRSALPGIGGALVTCWLLVKVRYPDVGLLTRLGLAALWTTLFAAAYTVHSLGHVFSGRRVNAPMDALVMETLQWRNVYHENAVTPQQHVGRASGGPLANFLLLALGMLLRPLLPGKALRRDVVEMLVIFNALIGGLSLLPTPMYDGGVLLKWALVAGSDGDEEAAEITVREAAFALGTLFSALGVALLLTRRILGGLLGLAAGFLSFLGALRRDM